MLNAAFIKHYNLRFGLISCVTTSLERAVLSVYCILYVIYLFEIEDRLILFDVPVPGH